MRVIKHIFKLLIPMVAVLLLLALITEWVPAVEVSRKHLLNFDAGHGGADGGAVSADGVSEAGLNLNIALKCYELSVFLGQEAMMTRESESALCNDHGLTIRQQKVEDTKNRVALVNEQGNAVLVSIHQNSLPKAPSTHGAMVFFNGVGSAQMYGEATQMVLNAAVNKDNEKNARLIGNDIYLMSHVQCPAILVECGFLSNATETAQLQTAEHQRLLSAAILAGCLSDLRNGGTK